MEMEMEAAPAHHGAVLAAAATTNPKKRSLDEVVPPVFVEEDDGAYGIAEMPKRFMLGNQQQHDKYSGRMAAFHATDVRITALRESARRSAADLILRLRAQDAARAAAPAGDS
jgi:uncharacterized ferredoxin-like protein